MLEVREGKEQPKPDKGVKVLEVVVVVVLFVYE